MTKRRKRPIPILLLWSKSEQRRFCDTVEKLVSQVNDLGAMLAEQTRKRAPRRKPAPVLPAGPQAVECPKCDPPEAVGLCKQPEDCLGEKGGTP